MGTDEAGLFELPGAEVGGALEGHQSRIGGERCPEADDAVLELPGAGPPGEELASASSFVRFASSASVARAIFWRSGVLLGALGGGLMSSALILTGSAGDFVPVVARRKRRGEVLSFLPLNCCVSVKVSVAPGWFV